MGQALTPGFAVAVMLLAAIVGGYLAKWIHLPRIVGYLVAGIGIKYATSGLPALRRAEFGEGVDSLSFVTEIALLLILFTIGEGFESTTLKPIWRTLWRVSTAEILLTGALTAVACAAAAWTLPDMSWGTSVAVGLLLGSIAVATAPGATYLVLSEYGAKGPTTDHVLGLTGLNNLASISGFGAVFLLCTWAGWIEAKRVSIEVLGLDLLLGTLGSLLLGFLLGGGLGFLHSRLPLPEMTLLFFGALFLFSAGDDWTRYHFGVAFNPMVAFLAAGATFQNLALDPARFERTVESISAPLFALFFMLAGWHLHLEQIPHLGWLGLAYVLARTAGKVGGVALGIRRVGEGARVGPNAGMGLLCQAGVAIGLGGFLLRSWQTPGGEPDPMARKLHTVILAAVALSELVGPVLVKRLVVNAGEVKVASLLRWDAAGAPSAVPLAVFGEKVLSLVSTLLPHRVRKAPAGRRERELTAKHIMRANVRFMKANATLGEVLHFIERSRFHDFIVHDRSGLYVGVVHQHSIRELMYEPTFAQLVRAIDLVDAGIPPVTPTATLNEMLHLFNRHNTGALAVVKTAEGRELIGMVEQRDLLQAVHKVQATKDAWGESSGG